MSHQRELTTEHTTVARRVRRKSIPVDCPCGERLAHRQGGRLLTYRIYTIIRSNGLVSLTCPQCRARTDVVVGEG